MSNRLSGGALGSKAGDVVSKNIAQGLKKEASNQAIATLPKSVKQSKLALSSAANSSVVINAEKTIINSSFSMSKEVVRMATEDNHRPLVLQIEQGDLLEEEPLFKYYYFNAY